MTQRSVVSGDIDSLRLGHFSSPHPQPSPSSWGPVWPAGRVHQVVPPRPGKMTGEGLPQRGRSSQTWRTRWWSRRATAAGSLIAIDGRVCDALSLLAGPFVVDGADEVHHFGGGAE